VPKHSPGRKTTNKSLVVVYGLKTADYTYFNLFYPAQRLIQEAANRGIPLRFLFPADLPAFLESGDLKITPETTIFLFRGAVPLSVIELVERCGFTVINPSCAVRIAGDKRKTAQFLSTQGIAHPRLFAPDDISNDLWPIVAKPRFGSRGNGVQLVSGPKDIPKNNTPYGEYILQEYIAASHGRDFRVFFAFGRILAAVERRAGIDKMGIDETSVGETGENPLVSNTCVGGGLHPSPFSPAVPDCVAVLIAKIAEKTGLRYGAIDFLYSTTVPDPAHLVVCELNAFPGFTALEQEGGFDIAGAIMEKIRRLFFSE